MNREQMLVCSDLFSVDLDDDLESGTLAFVLKDASSLLEVRCRRRESSRCATR